MEQASVLDQLANIMGGLPAAQAEQVALLATRIKRERGLRWIASVGPQTEAYKSPADCLLYGGQGGGGKTDLLLGLAFNEHRRSLILRRQYTDLSAITERAIQINGSRDGFNGSSPPKLRTSEGRLIEFGAAKSLGDEQAWQGQPHDLLGCDEAVHFLELQIRFLMGWVRSTVEGQRVRTVLATNPPLDASGQWIVGMFRPWLDITHPNPAKPGELRWFVTDPDGKDMEVDGPRPVAMDGRMLIPMSRTFIPASLRDNPFLLKSNYQANLDALPEPLRSAVRDGNFMAARQDSEWQVIPTAWVIAAQQRWTERPPQGVPMCAMGVDASGGGTDPMTIACRHDGWYAPLVEIAGKDIPRDRIGTHCAGIVLSYRRDAAKVIIDMGGGYGGGIYEHVCATIGKEFTLGYKGAGDGMGRTHDKQMAFKNKRTEALWRFREALNPDQDGGSPIALPMDQGLVADLTAPTWEPVSHKGGMAIKVESKEDVCARLGRSTDRGDAVMMAWSDGLKQANIKDGWPGYQRGRQNKVVLGHMEARRRR